MASEIAKKTYSLYRIDQMAPSVIHSFNLINPSMAALQEDPMKFDNSVQQAKITREISELLMRQFSAIQKSVRHESAMEGENEFDRRREKIKELIQELEQTKAVDKAA
jgi:hypothetical protein